jgi:hypothetical protein
MRLRSILPFVGLLLLASPIAAQKDHAEPHVAPSLQPLPAELAPGKRKHADVRSVQPDALELGLITGVVVGMAVGGTYRYLTYDTDRVPTAGCSIMSREMETLIFSIVGGSLGGVIGGATGYLLGRRDAVSVEAGKGGGVRMQVKVRH